MKNKKGMRKGKKMLSVLLYLVFVSLFLGVSPKELLDWRQLLLVLAGGIILYLPGVEKEDVQKRKKPDLELLARNTVYASFIETFVLMFTMLSDRGIGRQWTEAGRPLQEILMREIALNLRPLLYGACIWMVFGNDMAETENRGEKWQGGEGTERRKKEEEERNRKGEDGEGLNEGWQDKQRRKENREKEWTAGDSYQRFLELGLTRREAEVAVQVCKGLSNKEIGMELNISEMTVKKHISNIFEKLEVEKRQEIGKRLNSSDTCGHF